MSKRKQRQDFLLETVAHPTENGVKRKPLKIYGAVPSKNINSNTGILILTLGFCMPPENPFYIRLRRALADIYDLVVIGVEVMGTRCKSNRKLIPHLTDRDTLYDKIFARGRKIPLHQNGTLNFNEVYSILGGEDLSNEIEYTEKMLQQTSQDYLDYGVIQAIDLLTGIHAIREALPQLNSKRMHLIGSSLGAYLSHQVLRLAPNSFASLLDISGKPFLDEGYLINGHRRKSLIDTRNTRVTLVNDNIYSDHFPLSLSSIVLRNQLRGWDHECKARVRMITGIDDELVPISHKKTQLAGLLQTGANAELLVITDKEVDGKVIKHAGHSLGAEFYQLIRHYGDGLLQSTNDSIHGEFEKKTSHDLFTDYGTYNISFQFSPILSLRKTSL